MNNGLRVSFRVVQTKRHLERSAVQLMRTIMVGMHLKQKNKTFHDQRRDFLSATRRETAGHSYR